jgi:protease-4
MMDVATSGAYYISLPADMIISHPTTVTGSVGVIFLQPKVSGLMNKIGVGVDVKKFGKNKDMGSPFRDSSEEEQKLMQNAVNEFGERFMRLVQKHRKPERQALVEISTARVFLADEALKVGLIDKIGYLNDAVKESKILAGISEDARVVVYRRTEFPEDNYYNVAGVASEGLNCSAINIEIPEGLNLKTGFYYLWPGAIAIDR